MIVMGSCAGSTSGGAKVDRFVVLFKFLKNEFYKMMHPSTVTTVTINGKGTSGSVVQKTLAFLFLYVMVICIGGLAMSLMGLVCLRHAVHYADMTGKKGQYLPCQRILSLPECGGEKQKDGKYLKTPDKHYK